MTDGDEKQLPSAETLRAIKVTAASHFLPNRAAWGDDLRECIHEEIIIPIEPAINATYEGEQALFDFLRTEWVHFDCDGALTELQFKVGRDGAVREFAKQVNELGVFKPVRILAQPPVSIGVARADWVGEAFPFDIRTVVDFGVFRLPENSEDCDHGLRFHIATLVQKGYGCAVPFSDLILGPRQ